MRSMEMVEPKTVAKAVRALRAAGAVPLAGATDLIPAVRAGQMRPRVLVNLKRISGLAGVRGARGGLRIGVLTRVADLLEEEKLAAAVPLLVEAARGFGSAQIRAMATLGGNLCNAAPSADLALPLLALDARVVIQGEETREVDLCDFFRGPNRTVLRRGEVLTAVLIPKVGPRTGTGYEKLCGRRAMDLSLVSAAAVLQVRADGLTCAKVRLALGAVAPTPMRARKAEDFLEGKRLTPLVLREAAARAAFETRPITDLRASAEYRREMAQVLSARVLRAALAAARKEARG
jgi:aerobic carbon-monoxide dehydrogenase medium subunit